MARRRLLAIDTSDGLANLVLGVLAVLIVASLALIPLIGSADEEPAAAPPDTADEVVPGDGAQETVPDADAGAENGAPGVDGADVVDASDTSADVEPVPVEPVDSLTVEGAGGTAAGLVDTDRAGDGDAVAGGTDGATTEGADPGVGGDAGQPTAPATGRPDAGPSAVTTPPPASPAPTPAPTASVPPAPPPPPPEDEGDVVIPPEPDDDRYQPDDPDRIPSVTISTTPRDRLTRRVDVDDDGVPERVWSAVVGDEVHIRVDELVDGRWRTGPARRGPVADRLVDLRIADLTGDGRPEIWTWQWVATEGQSITLWDYVDGELRRMDASGGCWHGSNTFGLVGALVQHATPGRPIQIAAICEDPELPWWQWPAELYRWEGGRWTADRLVGKYR